MTAHTMHNPFIHSVPPCKSLKSLFLRICYTEVVSIAYWYYQKWVLIYFRSGHSMHSNLELSSHSKLSHKHVHNCVLGSYMKTFSHNSGCGLGMFQWKWLLLYQMAMINTMSNISCHVANNQCQSQFKSWHQIMLIFCQKDEPPGNRECFYKQNG